MEQDARDFTMKRFKEKKCKLVACTDVAARGIDVSDLTHVINVELPMDLESYVHRIGRTGRGGSKGTALSIVTPMEFRKIALIERITKAPIKRVELPGVDEIRGRLIAKAAKQVGELAATIKIETHSEFAEFAAATESMTKEDMQKALYARTLAPTIKKYREARDLTAMAPNRARTGANGAPADMNRGPARGQGQRFIINVGRIDGANPGDLLKFLHRTAGLRGSEVGRIDIRDKVSFFEIDANQGARLHKVKGSTWGQRKVMVDIADRVTAGAPDQSARVRRGPPTA